MKTCCFKDCDKPIREADEEYTDPYTALFCEEHGAIADALLEGDPIEMFKWSLQNIKTSYE